MATREGRARDASQIGHNMSVLIAWLAAALAFLVLDLIWLSTMNARLYRPLIGDLLAPKPRLAPAIAFYLIFISGLVFFAVLPGLDEGRLRTTLIHAAVYGGVTYATYDLTNHATLRVWDLRVTLADMAWGVLLSAAAASAAFYAASQFS